MPVSSLKHAKWPELALAAKRFGMEKVVTSEKVRPLLVESAPLQADVDDRNALVQKHPPTHEDFFRSQIQAVNLIKEFRLKLAGYRRESERWRESGSSY